VPAQVAATPSATAPVAALEPSAERDLRDYLSAEGIDGALMSRFAVGKPYEESERRPVVLALAAMKKLSPSDEARFAVEAKGRASFADPFARGRMLSVRGKLRSIKKETLTDDEISRVYPEVDSMAADDPRRTIYRVEFEAEGAGTITVFSLRAPRALVETTVADAPVGVTGLYVKHGGAAAGEQPLLIASHVAWYPDTPVGRLGMDVALFDDVRDYSTDLKAEREAFYQLLAAMKRADLGKLLDATMQEYSAVPLFNDPKSMRGTLIALQGKARRAVEVLVKDADIRSRFGIDRFYEVEIFTRDSQSNPIIFNLTQLPAGFPVGDDISVDVRIPGVYLTGFVYNRDATIEERERNEKPKMQKAPLLIGKSLERIDYNAGTGPAEWIFGAIVIGIVAALGLGAWVWSRNQGTARRVRQEVDDRTTGKSLNDLPGDYSGKPDFSKIEPREGT
jgi:type II secretory pathway pseudopilin PulG